MAKLPMIDMDKPRSENAINLAHQRADYFGSLYGSFLYQIEKGWSPAHALSQLLEKDRANLLATLEALQQLPE